ncbi:MAG TPA: PDZ domain-containing protein [Candidatus Polarisedimenticolaceae bacterium]
MLRIVLTLLLCSAAWAAPGDSPQGWLGASLAPVEDAATETSGVFVSQIVEDSPAEKAGLRGRDVIVGIDGVNVNSPAELIERIRKLPPNSWIGLRVVRRGAERQIDVRLGERPAEGGPLKLVRGWIGVRTIDLPPSLRVHFGAREEAGIMVSDLVPGGPAEAGGLELGDVIYEIDGEPVAGPGELYRLVSQSGVGNPVEIAVGRDGAPLTLEIVVAKAPPRENE